jgi:hypothetical protein
MSKSTKMGAGGNIITNNGNSGNIKYKSGGSGVGAQPIHIWRAKQKLASMCYSNYHPCKK